MQEVAPTTVTLAANSRLRTVATSLLVAAASVISDRPFEEPVDLELVSVLLSNLTGQQVAALEERAAHVRDLLAAAQDEGQLKRRYAAKAQELGLSVRAGAVGGVLPRQRRGGAGR